MFRKAKFDKPFFYIVTILCFVGFLAFFSASLSNLNSENYFFSLLLKQLVALVLGFLCLLFLAFYKNFSYQYLNYRSLYIYLAALLFQLFVFIPGLGMASKGAARWVNLGVTTIQPSEFLKLAIILLVAALAAEYGHKVKSLKHTLTILGLVLGPSGILLILTRDFGTLLICTFAVFIVLFVAKARSWFLLLLAGGGLSGMLAFVYYFKPYAWQRINSFTGSGADTLGADFQINQAIMTVGSGQISGMGFGNSLQKFSYLPEPLSDSIFAIIAEEWGFIGSIMLVALFTALIYRGIYIARRSTTTFGSLLAVGLVSLIGSQALFNIAAMIKLAPLSGMPLLFVSKGGSAMLVTLIICGLILNISRNMKHRPSW